MTPTINQSYTLVAFADASRNQYYSQFCYIIGFVIGPVCIDYPFHLLPYGSNLSLRLDKPTAAPDIFAFSEGVAQNLMLEKVYFDIFGTDIST